MSLTPPNSAAGYGKMYAAGLAGAATTVIVYIIDQFTKTPLPPEIVASCQTLIVGAAVFFAPHAKGN